MAHPLKHNHKSFRAFSKDFNEEFPVDLSNNSAGEVYTVRPSYILNHVRTNSMNLIIIQLPW